MQIHAYIYIHIYQKKRKNKKYVEKFKRTIFEKITMIQKKDISKN